MNQRTLELRRLTRRPNVKSVRVRPVRVANPESISPAVALRMIRAQIENLNAVAAEVGTFANLIDVNDLPRNGNFVRKSAKMRMAMENVETVLDLLA